MTIRAMQRAAVVVALAALAALSFAACGSDDPPSDSGSDEGAVELAEEATAAVEDLEERADDLASDLDRIDRSHRSLSKKFDRVHSDLRDSIANLRESLTAASTDASSARESAQAAIGRIESGLERLAVLENRFDYHLRKDH